MRVLLVKPNNLSDHIQPSLGLGYLAQQIKKEHDVDVFDCIKANTTSPTSRRFCARLRAFHVKQ